MRILDLFCGAGGAAMGYHRAFPDAEIVGIDINPQPNYPFTFVQGDALHGLQWLLDEGYDFDLVHASPPCQAFSTLRHTGRKEYVNLVDETQFAFATLSVPTVIENVPGAPIRRDLTLCGSMFGCVVDGKQLRRHRVFELSFPAMSLECWHDGGVLGVYGDLARNERPSNRGVKAGIQQAETLMGIDWMTPKELVQAIPPVYTEFIGNQLKGG